jgi:hypothetical protein
MAIAIELDIPQIITDIAEIHPATIELVYAGGLDGNTWKVEAFGRKGTDRYYYSHRVSNTLFHYRHPDGKILFHGTEINIPYFQGNLVGLDPSFPEIIQTLDKLKNTRPNYDTREYVLGPAIMGEDGRRDWDTRLPGFAVALDELGFWVKKTPEDWWNRRG